MKLTITCPDCGGKMELLKTALWDTDGNKIEIDTAQCEECGHIRYPSFE
jgi:uncharacterized Zn finger protein